MRAARPDDSDRLRAWRNDRATRRWFLDSTRVSARRHADWFSRRLADARCRIFIAEAGGHAVGQLRLEKTGRGAEVSFSVLPSVRGRGIGTAILRRAPVLARRELKATQLIAHVIPENVPSAVAFLKAGFEFAGRRRRRGTSVYEFRLRT
jgi:UDP-2,4-diacetamido-2,4,6-trideoxy-beta-L-altropyranose hydrolase